jgi:aspartate dehydrogenase
MQVRTVGLAGLGAIGNVIARSLAAGMPSLELVAVSALHRERAEKLMSTFPNPPPVLSLVELCDSDIVVEALPSEVFDNIADPAIEAGKVFIPCSAGALLSRPDLFKRAAKSGSRIIIPTGAIAGLDAIAALARGSVYEVILESRKPPKGFSGARYLIDRNIDVQNVDQPVLVFDGNAIEACKHFPANANVAAALALAGVGPSLTRVKIWADPNVKRNIHSIHVNAESARLTIVVENVPSDESPRTSKLASLSVLACLARLVAPLRVGS